MALTNEDIQAITELLEPIRREIKSINLTLENQKEMLALYKTAG